MSGVKLSPWTRVRDLLFDHAELVMAVVLIVGFCLAMGVAIFSEHRQQDACVRAGGTVEHYNSRVIILAVASGSGCTAFVPTEIDDWRCTHEGHR